MKFINYKVLKVFLLVFMCFFILLLNGCNKKIKEPVTSKNLNGKTIGVMNGYSTDFALSKANTGAKIYRYDVYSDLLLALKYNRLDAALMETDDAYVFCRINPQFKITTIFEENQEYAYPFLGTNKKLITQFNKFITEFRTSEIYKDILNRVKDAANKPFIAKKVPSTTKSNKSIKVCVLAGWEPVSYLNTATNNWEGCDIELIQHFGNSIGVKVNLQERSWQQMVAELNLGMLDIGLCPDSLLLKKDYEMKGKIIISDVVWQKDIVFVVKKEE